MQYILPLLLGMILVIVLLKTLADRLKIAYPILIVSAGLLLSFIPGLPVIRINPDIIFFLFLPPLLCEASWTISFKEMKKWWRIIGSFAFLVVFFTALSVAVVANHFIPGFSLAMGFLLGGIVSPPDAVSTGAITKFVKIPRATATILEGESLLNDASSLIIFRFALVAVGTGQFIWQQAAIQFFWMVIGGTIIGVILAWIFIQVHRRLRVDAPSAISLTLIEPYFMYWLAEQVHSSGVLAVVSGSLFMATRRLSFLNSSSRIRGYSVWESFVFILNGVVFMIIGLELPDIVEGLRTKGIALHTAVSYGILVTGVLILARIISSYVALIATLIFRPSVTPRTRSVRARWLLPLTLGWTGMRGVVSLAAALAIPVTLSNGAAFPHRNMILFITFITILLTLVIQGLTLPWFIRHAGVFDGLMDEPEEVVKQKLRKGLQEHTHQFLKGKHDNEFQDQAGAQKLLKHWEEKMKASNDDRINTKTKALFIEMLESQRQYLSDLNRDDGIDEETIRWELYQIDLEEERIKMI
jgi:CPA1 family monovalent cation:H+ antiporter